MNTRLRIAAVTIALLVALVGCGSEDSSSDQGAADPGPTATTETGGSPTTVTSVTLQRSGGKTGGTVRRTFEVGGPAPKGFTDAQLDQAINRAQTFISTDSTVPELPANTCCDRFVYTVVIGFSDGSSSTFTTVDGARTTPAFQDLLNQLS